LDDLGIERVTLVGHSLGGGVALLTAIKMLQAGRLDRVKALVLVSSAAMPQSLPFLVRLARIRALNIVALGRVPPRHVVRWILRQIVYERETISDEMVEGYAGPLAAPASRRALLDTARQIIPDNVHDIVAEYPALNVPVLLLWGEHDKVVPLWVGEQLSAVLPNAELVVLPRCGHVPPEERPMVSLRTVSAFLAKAGDAPAPE
jgi:pimeloyl-ACP methyl ester carboxylesterase